MIRTILGVIIGFVVLLLIQFVILTAAYLLLGADWTFQPGTFALSPAWLVIQAVFTLAAGVIAGKVCRVVAGRGWSTIPFIVLVLVLGLLASIPFLLLGDSIPARVGDIGIIQAMGSGRPPKWFRVLMPFVTALGIMMGGRSKKD